MLTRVVDRTGHLWAELSWAGDALVELRVTGARVLGATQAHPVLGPAHAIVTEAGAPLTEISAIDWARPTQIPAIAAPARLPPGAGGLIMNVLALLARDAGVPALRYAGPYPTAALFQTLARSFTTTATEAEFTAGFLDRAVRGARDELPFAFVPAPHTRVPFAGGHAELRADIERVVIGGVAYAGEIGMHRLVAGDAFNLRYQRSAGAGDAFNLRYQRSATPRSLVRDPATLVAHLESVPGLVAHLESVPGFVAHLESVPSQLADLTSPRAAEVWFGDAHYADVATFAADGTLLAGPHALPDCASDVIGHGFPPALRAALADLIADAVPAPLAAAARAMVAARAIRWADLGARAARATFEGFEVHAALWDRLRPHGLARLALGLAEALAPVVALAVVAESHAHGPHTML